MGPQGAVLSSEEMPPQSQIVGVLVPGGGFFPLGQALPEGQEDLLPANQAGSNQGNLPFPEGTAAAIQKISPTASDGLSEVASGLYPTPSGFRQPGPVTNGVFAEPTAGMNMEPSELREPPTSLVRLDKDNNGKQQHNLSRSHVRGDSYVPLSTVAKYLNFTWLKQNFLWAQLHINEWLMRQLAGPNGAGVLQQYAQAYSYADPFNTMWIHNFLPPHSSYYWLRRRPQQHETQQYEISMPVHPPPLPSQQTPILLQQPEVQEQPLFQLVNFIPTRQVQLQQYDMQPPFQQKPFLLPEGNQPVVQQQPSERQTQQMPPSLHYMSYIANQGAAPARLGIVSSEEMPGGGFGAPAYHAPGPNLFAMDARYGNMQPNLGGPGDYTVEDDQLGITEQPEVQGGANAGANPSGKGSNIISLDGTQGGALPNANSNLLNPAAQSKGPAGVPQATAAPPAAEGLPDSFMPFNADAAMPLDPTMFPNTVPTANAGNEAGYPQVGQDMWHFQEP
ncbi:ameloblastin [Podarcis lilfordi]|nr:ameloblastin [Podarcis lilfordi]